MKASVVDWSRLPMAMFRTELGVTLNRHERVAGAKVLIVRGFDALLLFTDECPNLIAFHVADFHVADLLSHDAFALLTGLDQQLVDLAAFERVVNAGITGESLSLVEKQYGKIKEAHTRLVRLKDEMSHGAEFQQNE